MRRLRPSNGPDTHLHACGENRNCYQPLKRRKPPGITPKGAFRACWGASLRKTASNLEGRRWPIRQGPSDGDELNGRLGRSRSRSRKRFNPSARQLVRWFHDQAALRTGSGNLCSGSARSRRQASSSPLRCAASSAAKASTPCGDQLILWCLQRADTAQSLYFSTRVLAIHNPARCRCW